MSTAARLTVAGLLLAAIALTLGTTVVPTHVTLGAGSLRCGTVLRPDRESEIAPLCGPAGANHLRAALAVGAFLAVLAVVPAVVERRRPGRHRALWRAWSMIMLFAAVAGVAGLGGGRVLLGKRVLRPVRTCRDRPASSTIVPRVLRGDASPCFVLGASPPSA